MASITSKYTLLVVDDSEMNRAILAEILKNYEIIEAKNGQEAIDSLHEYGDRISLVLLDYVMPVKNGFEVLQAMNDEGMTEKIPFIMISAENSPSYVEQAFDLGVIDFITRPFDALMVQHRVANTLQLYTKQKRLADMVEEQILKRERQSNTLVHILSHIVEFRNGESGMHVLHIQALVKIFLQKFLQKIRSHRFLSEDIEIICMASCLHDIGKIAIPTEILNKPGRLTDEEFEIMKKHAAIGADMLSKMEQHNDEPLLKVATDICRWHHERYDGKGYPDGLKGDQIPISAQVVALADVYDALTSKRVYKDALPHDKAVKMILNGECGAFNPVLLSCLEELSDDLERLLAETTNELMADRQSGKIINDLFRNNGINRSDSAVALLEKERTRSDFIDEMTEEVEFEYTVDPPVVKISSWAAEYTGLGEEFYSPEKNEKMLSSLSPDEYYKLVTKLRNTTPENPVVEHECRVTINGHRKWIRIVAKSIWSNEDPPRYTGVIGKMMNIDAMKSLIDNLEYRATHDSLTGLLNRSAAIDLIREKLKNGAEKCALIMLDVDFFKTANDSYGHSFGDSVLKHIASRLRQSVRGKNDIVARVGGDEFFVFLVGYRENPENIVKRIFTALNGKIGDFTVSVSMGIAAYDKTLHYNYEDLFLSADRALYCAKQSGRSQYYFYDKSMEHTFSNISPIDDQS